MHPSTTRSAGVAALLVLALTACGGAAEEQEQAAAAEETADDQTAAADGFEITDPWTRAANADDGMTAVYGEIANGTDADVTIVGAEHEAADMVELHEGVLNGAEASMREAEDGLVVPAGGTHVLEPGGDHIMLMELNQDLEPGTEFTVTVEFSDGSTAEFTAPVRTFAGGNEEYDGGDEGNEEYDEEQGHDEHAEHGGDEHGEE